jgi:hypothetical protein
MLEKVTYNKAFGIFLIITSTFIIGVSFIIGFSLNTITGGILLLMGILYLNGAAIAYTDGELMLKNIYGGTVRTYSFKTDNITVKEGAMYSNDRKIRVGSAMLNKTELNKLHEFVSEKNKF